MTLLYCQNPSFNHVYNIQVYFCKTNTFISGWDVMLLKVKIIQDVFFVLFEGTEVILPPTSPGLGDAEEDGAG